MYTVGSLGRGGATQLKLALSGAATSAAFASIVSAVVLPRNGIAGSFRLWQIGGVGGALLVPVADFAGQFAFDTRYPVGVVTGVLGAPYLVYLIARTHRAGGSM
ncbi:hypothetical protein Psi01_63080 [Planobispora siamensis]|uniref:FecCD transport family protein n=1 Tax=Planobispora siamensis TaxID=936338 RepID=A0A8J3SJR5_9ACTN|nr:hypothetical protein Psi01_63080 [Planobispora siamensis]